MLWQLSRFWANNSFFAHVLFPSLCAFVQLQFAIAPNLPSCCKETTLGIISHNSSLLFTAHYKSLVCLHIYLHSPQNERMWKRKKGSLKQHNQSLILNCPTFGSGKSRFIHVASLADWLEHGRTNLPS